MRVSLWFLAGLLAGLAFAVIVVAAIRHFGDGCVRPLSPRRRAALLCASLAAMTPALLLLVGQHG